MSEDTTGIPDSVVKVVDFTANKDTTSEKTIQPQSNSGGVIVFPGKPNTPSVLCADIVSPGTLTGSFSFGNDKPPLPSEVLEKLTSLSITGRVAISAIRLRTSSDDARDELEETLVEMTKPTDGCPTTQELFERQQKVFEKMLKLLQLLKPANR